MRKSQRYQATVDRACPIRVSPESDTSVLQADSWGMYAAAAELCPLGRGIFYGVINMKRDGFSDYHPLVNFLFFLGAIGSVVVIQHPAYLGISALAGLCYYGILQGRKGFLRLMSLIPLAGIIAALNPLFNTYGEHVLFEVFSKPYTLEALIYGGVLAGIFLDMMIWFGCYNQVLTSDKFSCLFARLIPSLSLLLTMVLRMIPGFIRKAKQIAGARKCIGKGAAGTLSEKLRDGVSILSVMTDWVLEGGIVTADSMRCRGYGSGKRTSYQKYTLMSRDFFLLGLMGILAVSAFFGGSTQASFTPELFIAPLSWGWIAYGMFMFLPAAIGVKEAVLWHILRSGI